MPGEFAEDSHPRDDHGKFTSAGGAVHASAAGRKARAASKNAKEKGTADAHKQAADAHKQAADVHSKAAEDSHDPAAKGEHQARANRHNEYASEHEKNAEGAKAKDKLKEAKEGGIGTWVKGKLEKLHEGVEELGEKGKEAANQVIEGDPLKLGKSIIAGAALAPIRLLGGGKKKEGEGHEHGEGGEHSKEKKENSSLKKKVEKLHGEKLEADETIQDDDVEG